MAQKIGPASPIWIEIVCILQPPQRKHGMDTWWFAIVCLCKTHKNWVVVCGPTLPLLLYVCTDRWCFDYVQAWGLSVCATTTTTTTTTTGLPVYMFNLWTDIASSNFTMMMRARSSRCTSPTTTTTTTKKQQSPPNKSHKKQGFIKKQGFSLGAIMNTKFPWLVEMRGTI